MTSLRHRAPVNRYGAAYRARYATNVRKSERLQTILVGSGLALLACAYVGWSALSSEREHDRLRDTTSLCLVHQPTPVAVLAALDTTNRLAADSGARFTALIRGIRDRLPRNGRLTIVPFGGDLGQSLHAEFDTCSPGRGAEADEMWEGRDRLDREYRARFGQPLEDVAARLRQAGPSAASPITQQIERMISDPAIAWRGQRRRLIVLTDGLQFTRLSPVYFTGAVTLPAPSPNLLAGVEVDYVELNNATHSALQTADMRSAWERWFRAAGAVKVNMYAPGYAPPIES